MNRPSGYLCTSSLLAAIFLSGCSTMSPSECKVSDWNDVGLRDGLAGATLSMLDSRSRDCGQAGVAIDTQRYLQGREQGLRTYCRLENAIPLGLDGKVYGGVCPATVDAEFRRRVQVGNDVNNLRSRVQSLDLRYPPLERRLREAKSDEERRRIRGEMSDLDRDLRRTRDQLRDAELALDRLR
jgi:hypothetical protein